MAKKKTRLETLQDSIDSAHEVTKQAQSELFNKEIVDIVRAGSTIIEAISHYCEEREIEIEDILPFLNQQMLLNITKEAAGLRLLKKEFRDSILQL